MEAKRRAKDSLFTDLFSDPEYLFQLYQPLHSEDSKIRLSDIEKVDLKMGHRPDVQRSGL